MTSSVNSKEDSSGCNGDNGGFDSFDDDGYPTALYTSLADRLAQQKWHEIGFGSSPAIAATENHEAVVDQMSAILESRLYDLQIHRMIAPTVRSSLTGNGGPGPPGGGAAADCSPMDFLEMDTSVEDYRLKPSLSDSIREFVSCIGRDYSRDVGFHSFEHAAHVTTSMHKLLSMVSTVENVKASGDRRRDSAEMSYERQKAEKKTFGISEDPLIRFAMVFSALIHDVGHTGVPNSVLVEEEDELAILHNDASVAEQNSLQVAFSLLQREDFKDLKRAIGPNPEQRKFFRKRVINSVMATDISDQERLQIVQSRWKEAFPPSFKVESSVRDAGISQEFKQAVERRRYSMLQTAPAVEDFVKDKERGFRRLGIRHSMDLSGMLLDAYPNGDHQLQQHAVLDAIMQASDVAHTMQSFKVFCKWNRRLFRELYAARLAGRINFDPSDNWYQNQIGFFTHYVEPLAVNLETCGVFGSTGTVFTYFLQENRKRWAAEGEELAEEIVSSVKEEFARARGEATSFDGEKKEEVKNGQLYKSKGRKEREEIENKQAACQEKSNGKELSDPESAVGR